MGKFEEILGKFEEILEESGRILNDFQNVLKILEKPRKIVDFSTNFRSTAETAAEILRKFLKYLTDFVEVFKILI